ncbi:MAG: BMP family ABC transporter substrate-binding protein [Clostridia bacterium]|nr:BMP family ABC transporter substrate-binding protein [Clostridia bacterium]
MKKLLVLLLVCMLAVPFGALASDETYEIALVTDVGNIDDHSFNQSSWEGVKDFAETNGITYNYYRPSEDSNEARIDTIEAAIAKGAKVVVLPGWLFADSAATIAGKYADINVLLLDSGPAEEGAGLPNIYSILYQEEQAGYFAGYAAVKAGYTKLGFLGGMDVPAVVRYGYGFVQGVNDAAVELGIEDEIVLKYWYSQVFWPLDEIKIKMDGWYTEGIEVVFACGGGIYLSCVAAAEQAGAKVIGVDTDQALDSELIITSAMKALHNSVVKSLTALYANGGEWPEHMAGAVETLGAKDDCVGLPTDEGSWRLDGFTVEEYEELFAKVKSGEIAVSDNIDERPEVVIDVDYQE